MTQPDHKGAEHIQSDVKNKNKKTNKTKQLRDPIIIRNKHTNNKLNCGKEM